MMMLCESRVGFAWLLPLLLLLLLAFSCCLSLPCNRSVLLPGPATLHSIAFVFCCCVGQRSYHHGTGVDRWTHDTQAERHQCLLILAHHKQPVLTVLKGPGNPAPSLLLIDRLIGPASVGSSSGLSSAPPGESIHLVTVAPSSSPCPSSCIEDQPTMCPADFH